MAETSAATGTSNAGTNVIDSTAPSTFTSSRTSLAAGSSQPSSTSGGSNGNPINATSNGQLLVGEGTFGALAVLALCLAVSAGLVL